jgi:hypothetical protein
MTAAIDRVDFEFGRVIQRGAETLRRNLPLLATVILLFYGLPNLGGTLLQLGAGDLPIFGPAFTFTGSIYELISLVGFFAVQPMIVYVLVKDQDGQHATLGGCVHIALKVFGPALAVMILYGLAVALGLVALVVPGLMIAAAFLVAMPAIVVERLGIQDAFYRSRWLTRGYRWHVFGLIVGLVLLSAFLETASSSIGRDHGGLWLFEGAYAAAHAVVEDLLEIVGCLFSALLVASVYCELRLIKEDATSAELADALD